MANASRDENNVPTLLGVSSTDGATVIPIGVTVVHKLKVADGTTGSDLGPTNAKRDQNNVPTLMGVSSVDGVTPVPIYSDDMGHLLIDTN